MSLLLNTKKANTSTKLVCTMNKNIYKGRTSKICFALSLAFAFNASYAQNSNTGNIEVFGNSQATVLYRKLNGDDLSLQKAIFNANTSEKVWRESMGLVKGGKILLNASSAKAPADGRSQINLKIEIFDEAGKPVTKPTRIQVETNIGNFQTFDSPFHTLDATGALRKTEINRLEIAVHNGVAELVLNAPSTPGTSLLKVSSGDVVVQGEISFLPDLRGMLAVGIVEGSINFTKAKGVRANDIKEFGFSETLRNWEKTSSTVSNDGTEFKTAAGRVALFVKGTIKGEYLLTAAVDSDKITSQKLFRDIDPNTFYPVYGDSSAKVFDAQSSSKLYVRVDKDRSYALYGDFNTASDDSANKLSSYSRNLTGGKVHFENETLKVNLYAARTANKGYVDEQPARGISGPYALERPNAIANTESVELIVRSRAEPALILSKTKLARFSDYDFEPFSGRILFREPVASVDENNNPVFIRISYEVDEDSGDKHWIGGVDAKVKLGDNISIGASYSKDNDVQTPYEIAGANIEVKLGAKTYFVAEVAQSKGTSAYNQSFSAISDTNPLTLKNGRAGRVELRHDGQDLKARIYATRSDAQFQNISSGVVPGKTEIGASASYIASKQLDLNVNIQQTKDQSGGVTDGANRESLSVSAGYKINEMLKVDVGVNSVKEYLINGSGGTLSNTGASLNNNSIPGWGFNGTGLLSTPSTLLSSPSNTPSIIENEYTSGRIRLTGTLNDKANIYGEYEQAFDDTQRKRFVVGGEYKFSDKSRIYASHELTNTLTGIYGLTNDGSRNASTVVGLSSSLSLPFIPDGQVYGELRAAGATGNKDIAAVAGIRNLWQVNPGLGFTTALERQQIYQASGEKQDATAVSLGLDYTPNAHNKFNGKLEYRTSDIQNQWLGTLAYTRMLSENWSALAREAYIRSEGRGLDIARGVQLQNQLQVGLAYRDVSTGRWNGLIRLENRINRSSLTADLKDEESWILSTHGTHRFARNITLHGQLAAKYGSQAITNDGTYNIYNGRLASARIIWDINDRFDASVYGSYARDKSNNVKGIGIELGAKLIQNLWVSAGYTKGNFADVDQFSANTNWSGWHARLRYKFDENSLGIASKRVEEVKPVAAIESAMPVQVAVPAPIIQAPPALAPAPVPVPTTVTTPIVQSVVVAPKYEKITLAAGALFAHNKSSVDQILPEGRTQLNNLTAKLKTLSNIEKITISGHADITNGTGDANYNENLSLARATSVKSYMVSQGLNVSQVSVVGYGGIKPVITSCSLPKGAVQTKIGVIRGNASQQDMDSLRACLLPNRRVEVEIFGQTLAK